MNYFRFLYDGTPSHSYISPSHADKMALRKSESDMCVSLKDIDAALSGFLLMVKLFHLYGLDTAVSSATLACASCRMLLDMF